MCDSFPIHADNYDFTVFFYLLVSKELSEQLSHTDKLTLPKLSFKYVNVQPLPVSIHLSISFHVNKII